jgi:hypothetical protein
MSIEKEGDWVLGDQGLGKIDLKIFLIYMTYKDFSFSFFSSKMLKNTIGLPRPGS